MNLALFSLQFDQELMLPVTTTCPTCDININNNTNNSTNSCPPCDYTTISGNCGKSPVGCPPVITKPPSRIIIIIITIIAITTSTTSPQGYYILLSSTHSNAIRIIFAVFHLWSFYIHTVFTAR